MMALWIGAAWAGTLTPEVSCTAQPEFTYALYKPDHWTPAEDWPLLVVLDPQGEAEVVSRFTDAADQFGWVIASPSGPLGEDLGPHWSAMLADAGERAVAGRRAVFVTGLGVGARAAWRLGQLQPRLVAGVLGIGGSTTSGIAPRSDPGFAWYGVTSTLDVHRAEAVSAWRALRQADAPAALQTVTGAATWPSADTIARGLAFLLVTAEAKERVPTVPGRAEHWHTEVLGWAERVHPTTDTAPVLTSWPDLALPDWFDTGPQRRMRQREARSWARETEWRTRVVGVQERFEDLARPSPTVREARRWLGLDRLERLALRPSDRGRESQRMLALARLRIGTMLVTALRTRGYPGRADVAEAVIPGSPDA